MTKLPPPPSSRPTSFFQREDWLLSAGLVLVIYFIILLLIHLYIPDSHFLKYLVHLLPLFAIGMAWKGIRDRDERLSRGRASRAMRRRAEYELAKIEKKTGNQAGVGPDEKEKKK